MISEGPAVFNTVFARGQLRVDITSDMEGVFKSLKEWGQLHVTKVCIILHIAAYTLESEECGVETQRCA
jgi:hypothetical protein